MENLEACLKKLGDENWRELSNTVVYIRCKQKLEVLTKAGFKVDPRNDGFLAMCFIDHTQGLSFYVISAAHIRGADIFVSPENKSSAIILRAFELAECLYLNQQYIEIDLSKYFDYAASIKKDYEQNIDDVLYIRDITELDDLTTSCSFCHLSLQNVKFNNNDNIDDNNIYNTGITYIATIEIALGSNNTTITVETIRATGI